jgi:hypothetical protein
MARKSTAKGGVVRVETWGKAQTRKVAVRVPAGGDRSGNKPGTFYGATNFRQVNV